MSEMSGDGKYLCIQIRMEMAAKARGRKVMSNVGKTSQPMNTVKRFSSFYIKLLFACSKLRETKICLFIQLFRGCAPRCVGLGMGTRRKHVRHKKVSLHSQSCVFSVYLRLRSVL